MGEEHKIVSRLIDYIEKYEDKKEINWRKYCWKDGCIYQDEDLIGHLDIDFAQTTYHNYFGSSEIYLEYFIDWGDETSSFRVKATKWTRSGLKPIPESFVLFSYNPFFEKEKEDIPICQSRYHSFLRDDNDAAEIAVKDFIENAEKLSDYFVNMQEESLQQYNILVERFKKLDNIRGCLR